MTYDPKAKPWNAVTPWTDSAVSDLVASLNAGDDVAEIALFLQREESDVREKMAELVIQERAQ